MLIGIDGGGTKNELVLCGESGQIVNRLILPGTNASDLGAKRAALLLSAQIRALVENADAPVTALFAGLSGGGAAATRETVHAVLAREFQGIPRLENGSDALNGLNAGVGMGDGMVVIAGTGTSAFVRRNGCLTQVGGWGYLIDDAGSGYWIGRAVLCAAFRDRDGRSEKTLLTDLAERQMGCPADARAIPLLYEGGKRKVASFAPLAFAAADLGDKTALDIVNSACRELALLISSCARHLDNPPYRAVLSGSLWQAPRLKNGVTALVSDDYDLIQPDLPPVYGAVIAAAALVGLTVSTDFHDAFAASYSR